MESKTATRATLRWKPAADRCAETLRQRFPGFTPRAAFILGSAGQSLLRPLENPVSVAFDELPGFPALSVPGHPGRILAGTLEEVPILVVAGRPHHYEGYTSDQIAFPIQVLSRFPVSTLLLTNAAGGIREDLTPGTFLCLEDHINWAGFAPLQGLAPEDGTRFVDLGAAYDPEMRRWMAESAAESKIPLRSGVYLAAAGPQYETPAEIRAFRALGADAVGMSTVAEVITAQYLGLRVTALSCITNRAAGLGSGTIHHEEVLETATTMESSLERMVRGWLRRLRS